jgi:hypothetical protein
VSVPADGWWFDAREARSLLVEGAPRPGVPTSSFAAVAVPQIAATGFATVATPCVVVARVMSRTHPSRVIPGGPRGRAKALLDVLHDDRQVGPHYAELGATAPLADDDALHVSGLGVEVRAGEPERVEYRIGSRLSVAGQVLASADVDVDAPNDIWASAAEKLKTATARVRFGEALVASWRRAELAVDVGHAAALVVRHRPGRDEDNTWETWIGALIGTSRWSAPLWGPDPPLARWKPRAIASVADPDLPAAVRYEVWGAA